MSVFDVQIAMYINRQVYDVQVAMYVNLCDSRRALVVPANADIKCCVPRRICVTHSFPFEIVVRNCKLVLHVSNDIAILDFISESTKILKTKQHSL